MAKHTALCVLLCAAQVYGHGHVITPPSRVELCKTGGNANCGQIIWEPYSVEGPDGWPADGTIAAGGGHSRFPELNVQTSTRWEKVAVTSGPTKFAWKFLVNHVTKDYKYYITHAGWDSAAPLTRATFETEPFCVVDGGMVEPPAIDEHTCNVPTREGYHIILSVWDVGDTTNSFFNVIDALFSGASPPVPVPAPTVPAPVPTSPVTPPVCATSVHCMYVACMQDPACCESGASCDVYNTHYAQCVQAAPSPSTPPTPMPPSPSTPPVATQAPTPAPPTPTQAPWPTTPSTPPVCATSVACIYAACEKDRACCEEPGASCAYYNSYYAQCVQGTTSPSTPPPTPPVTTPPVPAPVPVTTPPSASCPSDTSGCGCDWTDNGAKCNTDDGSECYCKCCCQHTGQCAWQGGGGGGGGGGSGSTCALPSGLDADVAAVDNTGFATCHGKLRLSGLQLVGAQGEAVQLMGMSSHGLHWFANCYTKESITHLVTRWGINVFRAAMYIGEGGYGTNPALKQTVLDIVQWCKELGIYVIVDWHMLSPGNPNDGEYAGADAFWQDMARTLKDETHVLYEIANEPNGVSWGEVVSYHNRILALIRAEDAETVVLAGTPTWSQDIHEAAARPVDLPHNVMYVFHFYAGSHTHLQSRVQEVASQIPLFVSEWGTSEASGDGGPFLDNAHAFLEGFKSAGSQGVQLSWTSWSLADKAEVSAALQAGACASGDWDSVSCTGSYVRTYIRTNAVPCAGPAPVPVPPVPVPTPPTPPCNPINTEEAVVRDLWRPTAVNSLPAYAVSENTLGWTLGDDQVTLHNFPPVLLKDGVRAFYPDQTSEIPLGAEIQVECPANCDDTPCEVIVVTYHCVPCSSATNGKFPATMPLAGWAPGHCSPRFSFLADRHRMVGFRKLVGACETEVLPATEVALSNIAVFVRQGAHDCGLFVQEEMCEDSNECAWKDGACSSTWCPAAIPTGPPTCAPCAQTEIDLD